MLKKTFAFIIVFCVLLTSVSAFEALPYHKTETEDIPYGLFEKLGIVNREEYASLENGVTKGMFVRWVVKMSGVEESIFSKQPKQIFLDVTADNEYAAEVEYAYNKGIVRGDGYGRLGVDDVLGVNDAATMAARAIGYDIDDTLMLKAKNEIADSMDANAVVTVKIAMGMMWRALCLKSVKYDMNGTHFVDESEILLEGLFHTYCYEGIIDADPMMDMNGGASKIGENKISLNGRIYDADSDIGTGYAGLFAKIYVRKTNGSAKVIYVNPVRNTIKVYDEDEIASYEENLIKLKTNKDIKVSDTASTIENFKLIYVPSSGYTIPEGATVVTIDNNGDNRVDCVFIYSPDYGKVTATDTMKNVIYATGSDISTYNLDEYEIVKLYDFDGNEIKLGDVVAGSIAEIYATEDKQLLVAFVGEKSAEITLSGIGKKSDEVVLKTAEGIEYKLSPCFGKLDGLKEIDVKVKYKALFDSKGRIAAVYQASYTDLTYGYLFTFAEESSLDSNLRLKIYNINGEMLELDTASKVRIVKDETESSVREGELLANLKSDFKPTLVRYQLNEDSEISKIEYPSENRFSNGFRCVGIAGSATSGAKMYDARAVKSSGKIEAIGGQILFDSNITKCIVIPSDLSKDENWKALSAATAIVDDMYYQSSRGYAVNPDSMTADVILIDEDIMQNIYADSYRTVPVLVSGFATEYDAEDDKIYDTVLAYKDGAEMSYRLKEETTAQYTTTNGTVIPLEVGDVIRLTMDYDNEVASIKLLYDESDGRAYGISDGMYDHSNNGYGYQQRTNVGTPYKIIGNVMYMIKDGETEVSTDIFKTDVGTIYEFDADAKEPIRVATANDIETLSNNPNATNKVFIMLNYQVNLITVIYK